MTIFFEDDFNFSSLCENSKAWLSKYKSNMLFRGKWSQWDLKEKQEILKNILEIEGAFKEGIYKKIEETAYLNKKSIGLYALLAASIVVSLAALFIGFTASPSLIILGITVIVLALRSKNSKENEKIYEERCAIFNELSNELQSVRVRAFRPELEDSVSYRIPGLTNCDHKSRFFIFSPENEVANQEKQTFNSGDSKNSSPLMR